MRLASAALVVLVSVSLGTTPARAADPVSAVVTLERASITVGDRIGMSLIVDTGPGFVVSDPSVARQIGDFEVVETRASTRSSGGAQVRYTFRYVITAWTVGDHTLPPIGVAFVGPDGAPGAALTDPLAVRVTSVIGPGDDASDIRPLKAQLGLPEAAIARVQRLILGAAGAVAATALAALAFWLLLRRRGAAVPTERLTPARRALRDLDQLAGERLPEQGRTAEHYERLAASLRRYVVDHFRVEPGRTSREMRAALERSGLERTQAASIYELLREADEVRFRHATPYPAHAQNAVRAALEIVRRAASAEEYEIGAVQPQ